MKMRRWRGQDLSVGPRVVIEVRDPRSVKWGAASDDAMYGVTLVKEELCQVGTILSWWEVSNILSVDFYHNQLVTCDSSDKRNLSTNFRYSGFSPTMQIIFLHYYLSLFFLYVWYQNINWANIWFRCKLTAKISSSAAARSMIETLVNINTGHTWPGELNGIELLLTISV